MAAQQDRGIKMLEYLPFIQYEFDGKAIVIRDVIAQVELSKQIKAKKSLYQIYEIADGETPHDVAFKFYKDPNLNWVILVVNDIRDPYFDWPMSSDVLLDYVASKYDDINGVHHYELDGREVQDNSSEFVVPITNIEYETKVNDEKKRIRILAETVLPSFIAEVEKALSAV